MALALAAVFRTFQYALGRCFQRTCNSLGHKVTTEVDLLGSESITQFFLGNPVVVLEVFGVLQDLFRVLERHFVLASEPVGLLVSGRK